MDVRLREAARQHRVERECDEHRHADSRDDREAELTEELADDAGHERDRHEHGGGDGEEVVARTARSDLLRAVRAPRGTRILAYVRGD